MNRITIILFVLISSQTYTANIIFDLGGILLKPNTTKAAWHLGPCALLKYSSCCGNPEVLTEKFFDVLRTIQFAGLTPNLEGSRYENELCPDIMAAWYRNELSCDVSLKHVKDAIKNLIDNQTEQLLLERIAELTFNPETHSSIMEPIQEGKKLVEACKRQMSHVTKKPKHRLFLGANVNIAIGQKLMQKKELKELFDHFDGIVFSGEVHCNKPASNFYKHLVDTYQLDPKDCYCIDAQSVNLQAAQEYGMTTIACENGDIALVRQQLVNMGLIKD